MRFRYMDMVWQMTSLESAHFLRLSGHYEQRTADKVHGDQDFALLYWSADYDKCSLLCCEFAGATEGVACESLHVWGLEGCGVNLDTF